jgi:autotransporter adhesin
MAINRPTTKTIISTAQWGVPITDAVNANTTDVAALKTATNVTAWSNLPLKNGFSNFSGTWTGGQYRKVGTNTVQLRGMITTGVAWTQSQTPFTLPVGYRPLLTITFLVTYSGSDGLGGPGRVELSNNGDCTCLWAASGNNANVYGWMSLSGVQFYLD